jgi:hypothetical protein
LGYGYFTEFSPCLTNKGFLSQGFLYAEPIHISAAVTITGLGAYGAQPEGGVQGVLALYTAGPNGPADIVLSTDSGGVFPGNNVFAVTPGVSVAAGDYWIAAQFDMDASICEDSAATNSVVLVPVAVFGVFPSPYGMPTVQVTNTIDLNFYVISHP